MIDVWGADHGGYVKRMQAAVKAVSDSKADLDVKLCQLVKLLRGGEPVKSPSARATLLPCARWSTRWADAARFMMIFRKNDATLDFDLAKVVEQSKDNPVFYVQYAHARCASVFRQAGEAFPGADFSAGELAKADLSILSDEAEMELSTALPSFPGPSRRRRRLTSRIGSHFTFTIWPAPIAYGIRAKTCRNYALLI